MAKLAHPDGWGLWIVQKGREEKENKIFALRQQARQRLDQKIIEDAESFASEIIAHLEAMEAEQSYQQAIQCINMDLTNDSEAKAGEECAMDLVIADQCEEGMVHVDYVEESFDQCHEGQLLLGPTPMDNQNHLVVPPRKGFIVPARKGFVVPARPPRCYREPVVQKQLILCPMMLLGDHEYIKEEAKPSKKRPRPSAKKMVIRPSKKITWGSERIERWSKFWSLPRPTASKAQEGTWYLCHIFMSMSLKVTNFPAHLEERVQKKKCHLMARLSTAYEISPIDITTSFASGGGRASILGALELFLESLELFLRGIRAFYGIKMQFSIVFNVHFQLIFEILAHSEQQIWIISMPGPPVAQIHWPTSPRQGPRMSQNLREILGNIRKAWFLYILAIVSLISLHIARLKIWSILVIRGARAFDLGALELFVGSVELFLRGGRAFLLCPPLHWTTHFKEFGPIIRDDICHCQCFFLSHRRMIILSSSWVS